MKEKENKSIINLPGTNDSGIQTGIVILGSVKCWTAQTSCDLHIILYFWK